VYDGIINLIILGIVWKLRKRGLPDGMAFALFAALYAATRFSISFMRQERVWFWDLQQAQVVAILMLISSLVGMALLWRRSTPVQAS
jgi:phosphatidylglycerol:prolipoprotein diacylglycerol transferase